MKTILFLTFTLLVISFSLIFRGNSEEVAEKEALPESSEAAYHQEIIFMLQYIGRDYRFAVADGKMINEFEFQEMVFFCNRLTELYLQTTRKTGQNFNLIQFQELRKLVSEKADRRAVSDITDMLIEDIVAEFKMKTTAPGPPNIDNGRRLYFAGGCAVCHGESGAGNGRAAAWLSPGPGNFQDPELMKEAQPYQFFNIIQLGVIGTGMPSYRDAFSEQETWDIAHYLMTLPANFSP